LPAPLARYKHTIPDAKEKVNKKTKKSRFLSLVGLGGYNIDPLFHNFSLYIDSRFAYYTFVQQERRRCMSTSYPTLSQETVEEITGCELFHFAPAGAGEPKQKTPAPGAAVLVWLTRLGSLYDERNGTAKVRDVLTAAHQKIFGNYPNPGTPLDIIRAKCAVRLQTEAHRITGTQPSEKLLQNYKEIMAANGGACGAAGVPPRLMTGGRTTMAAVKKAKKAVKAAAKVEVKPRLKGKSKVVKVDIPAPAPAPAPAPEAVPAPEPDATGAKLKQPSLLDSAAQVLAECDAPQTTTSIVEKVLAQKLWSSSGLTPAATLNSAIIREIKTKGDQSRFRKTGRGLFEAVKHG
jgi:hypothetical protein